MTFGAEFPPFIRFVHRLQEVLKAKRFQQIIQCIYFEAFDGILRISCCEDNQRLFRQGTHKVHPIQVGHIDINKHQINLLCGKNTHSIESVLAGSYKIQKRYTGDISRQLGKSQRLIINSYTIYHNIPPFCINSPAQATAHQSNRPYHQ